MPLYVLNDLYFKTTYSIRPHFLGPIGGLKMEGLLYKFSNPCDVAKPICQFTQQLFSHHGMACEV